MAIKITFKEDFELTSTDAIYFGDPATDGTWRIVRSGNNFSMQRRETSAWVDKGGYTP